MADPGQKQSQPTNVRHHLSDRIIVRRLRSDEPENKIRKQNSPQPFHICRQDHHLHVLMLALDPASNIAVGSQVPKCLAERHLAQRVQRKVRRHVRKVDRLGAPGPTQILAPEKLLERRDSLIDLGLHPGHVAACIPRRHLGLDVVVIPNVAGAEHAVCEGIRSHRTIKSALDKAGLCAVHVAVDGRVVGHEDVGRDAN